MLDSRGNPTVEAEVLINNNSYRAIVPSGASTGKHEAVELRDNNKTYNGKSVTKAVKNIKTIISKKLTGMDINHQESIDKTMIQLDGTKNKSNLGANSIIAVSMAVARAAANENNIPLHNHLAKLANRKGNTLPIPMLNVINGGKHAGMENDIQEYMIMPNKAKSFSEALQQSVEIYHILKKELKKNYGRQATLLADEGGFSPKFKDLFDRLEIIQKAIDISGYKNIKLALDAASTEFYKNNKYHLGNIQYDSNDLIDIYKELVKKNNIISLEDGMAEDDWQGWKELNKKLNIQIVGDDLLVTNVERINRAIKEKSCNALLLKVNQIGTVTESIEAANLAIKHDWNVVVSHRSGETEDPFIADLAVALDAGQCKFGAPARSDRNAKYNQLLRIEENIKNPKYGVKL